MRPTLIEPSPPTADGAFSFAGTCPFEGEVIQLLSRQTENLDFSVSSARPVGRNRPYQGASVAIKLKSDCWTLPLMAQVLLACGG